MHTIALALDEHSMLYETAIAAEVFGVDRPNLSPRGEWYDFVVCAPAGVETGWLPSARVGTLSALREADTIVVASTDLEGEPDPALLAELRAAASRGTRIASLCTGAFVLAAAGLLDGRPAATHWMHAAELSRLHPTIDVKDNVLYVDDGQILTSAGKTASLDLCLHLVHLDHGAGASNGLARMLVVPSHRSGGQKQFVVAPADPVMDDRLGEALEWVRAHVDEPLTVEDMASRAALSSRQLARRMIAEVGIAPLAWIHNQRILRAQDLLERTDAGIEEVAARCGMGTATTLRRHFQRSVGVSPTAYRAAFLRTER